MLIEECQVCMSRGVNKQIECSTCHKCICVSCCNFIKSFKYEKELKNEDKCGVSAVYKCPYCRCKTEVAFSKLSREDLLEFIKIDYIIFMIIGNKYDTLQEKYEELKMKGMKIEHLRTKDNGNEVIDFLIEENRKQRDVIENIEHFMKKANDTMMRNIELEEKVYDLRMNHKDIISENQRLFGTIEKMIKKLEEIIETGKTVKPKLNKITKFITEFKSTLRVL